MSSSHKSIQVTIEEVKNIARLCHIGLTESEAAQMKLELSHILEQFQDLANIDTTGVEPTGAATNANSIMRDDSPKLSLPLEDVLANAPRREGDYFRVSAVMEEPS
tara:strand:- start:447 stop:764 length:318 start_codon:yes stop_codon:yes gene_type:complete